MNISALFRPLLLALLFALPLGAAETLPTAGKAVGLVRDDTPGSWAVVSADFSAVDVKEFEGDDTKGYLGCFFEGPAGKYLVIKSGSGKLKTFAVILGGVAPVPVPVPGPGPEPVPNPPAPVPTIAPVRVMMVYETDPAGQEEYSKDQKATLTSLKVIQWCNSHCSKGPGNTVDRFYLDDDEKTILPNWVDIYRKALTDSGANTAAAKEPWLMIEQKGVIVHSGQIKDEGDTLFLLKKYGGE
jgi:hypothetical protein